MVVGNRKSALGSDVFFLDIWAKQKSAWRTLTMQDVVLAKEPPAAANPPAAAAKAYEIAGVSPADLDLVELHDCFATAELIHYEAASRGADTERRNVARALLESDYVVKKWEELFPSDPWYNPNLTFIEEDYSLAWPPRIGRFDRRPPRTGGGRPWPLTAAAGTRA